MDANRSTTTPTREALTNLLSRGGTVDWKRLYAQARSDGRFREELRRRLATVDTEVSEGAPGLWSALLGRMDGSTQGLGAPPADGPDR